MRKAYEMAIAWDAVARLMQYGAVRDASAAGEMLMYVQAIAKPKDHLSSLGCEMLLSLPNMSKTGRRLAFLPIFKGMRLCLLKHISAKFLLVNDAVGTFFDI